MRTTSKAFEVQIRDTTAHTSDSADADAGATVVEDQLNNADFDPFEKFKVYVEDDHDQGFDVDVQSTAVDDTDYSGAVSEGSVTLAAGAATGVVSFDGPVGLLRLSFTAPTTAPTTGSCRVTVEAIGSE